MKNSNFEIRISKFPLWIFALALTLVYAAAASGESPYPAVEGRVVRVMSGNSIAMKLGEQVVEVQYIGVQTPRVENPKFEIRNPKSTTGETGEVSPDHARKAGLLNAELVDGKIVHLEFDALPRAASGRLLAYVFLLNGTFINAELLLHGYAEAVYTPPNGMYRVLFQRLENQARSIGRGMWRTAADPSPPGDDFGGPYIANRKFRIFHRPDCPWIKGLPPVESARFQRRQKVLLQGYLPCQHCKP